MSTLAAARADNFYFPPDWAPNRGGLNKFNKSHGALGKRANKLASHGILVVRFEMMYNAWCLGCKRPIGRGTRYNADKKRVDHYFSTPVYEFNMKCATCPQRFVIRTDPKNRDYKFVSGIRRKVEGYTLETARESEAVVVDGEAERAVRVANALAALEHSATSERQARSAAARLDATMTLVSARSREAPRLNKIMRQRARVRRRESRELKREAAALGLGIPLLPRGAGGEKSDEVRAVAAASRRKRARAKVPHSEGAGADSTTRRLMRRVASQSIFDSPGAASTKRASLPPGDLAARLVASSATHTTARQGSAGADTATARRPRLRAVRRRQAQGR